MRVSPKKENWLDYSSKLNFSYIPRILYILFTRPKPAIKKALYIIFEKRAFDKLNKTVAKSSLKLITAENDRLGTRTGQYDDIWNLYSITKERSPSVVWEYGPGWTTVGLVAGIIDSGSDGIVYAIEADKDWFKWYKEAFSKLDDEIKSRIKLVYSPTEITDDYDERSVRHTILPEKMPDLVHIDGCSNSEDVDIVCDIVDLEDQLPNICTVILDGRVNNLRFLQRNLKRETSLKKRLLQNELMQPVLTIQNKIK